MERFGMELTKEEYDLITTRRRVNVAIEKINKALEELDACGMMLYDDGNGEEVFYKKVYVNDKNQVVFTD